MIKIKLTLTSSDKTWIKTTIDDTVHEKIAELIVDHIQPTLATKEDAKSICH